MFVSENQRINIENARDKLLHISSLPRFAPPSFTGVSVTHINISERNAGLIRCKGRRSQVIFQAFIRIVLQGDGHALGYTDWNIHGHSGNNNIKDL